MTRLKAEMLAFERNAKKDGFTYWAEINDGEWQVYRRGRKVAKEAI